MALELESEIQPEPQSLAIGCVSLTFPNDFTPELGDHLASLFLGWISKDLATFPTVRNMGIGQYAIDLESLFIELVSIQPGSIKINYSLIALIILGGYNVIGEYPSFKEGFSELQQDLRRVISTVVERNMVGGKFPPEPDQKDEPHIPFEVAVLLRDEDEVTSDLAELAGF